MEQTFEEFIAELKGDKDLSANGKIELLNEWKGKLKKQSANRLMDKEQGEKLFKWLRLIDEALKEIAH